MFLDPNASPPSVEEAVTSSYENNLCLNLDKEMMAFIVGVYIFTQRTGERALSASDLKDIFVLVNILVAGEDETLERRGNNAINRLKEQGLFAKVEETYALTFLGQALGQHWENSESLSQRNLVHYASELRLRLDRVLDAAVAKGKSQQHWLDQVELPLRETISELISSIDRRQQGMVNSQKKIQRIISERISSDWISGIDACEKMLNSTGAALEELHTILLREADAIQEMLTQIADHCLEADQPKAVEAVNIVQNQMEMVRNWADFSFNEWSRYFYNVHDYIRMSVRTDPNRHFADRIKKAIQFHCDRPWALNLPAPPNFIHLREEAFDQPIKEIEVTGLVNRVDIEDGVKVDNSLRLRVQQEVALRLERDGVANLVEILTAFMPDMDRHETFEIAGDLVNLLAESGIARTLEDRTWTSLDNYQLQDLTVTSKAGRG